jgi:catechol 2,3-dioxygenase-like lactoylglutathione lyase family enzyme
MAATLEYRDRESVLPACRTLRRSDVPCTVDGFGGSCEARRSIHFVSLQEQPMKRIWAIIGVADVGRSIRWYQSLFGQPETPPAHDYFGQIVDTDGTVLLCLHQWGAHEHPSLGDPGRSQPGNGLLLFFRVDDFDEALPRARALVTRLEEEPHVSANTGTREFALRDPDGYHVMVSALDAA